MGGTCSTHNFLFQIYFAAFNEITFFLYCSNSLYDEPCFNTVYKSE
jgi:hypothetical protein